MDQNLNKYRMSIRSKKWWWPLFAFIPEVALQNAWLLYRQTPSYQERKMDFLAFRRELCKVYFALYSKQMLGRRPGGRPRSLSQRLPDDVRFDGIKHYIRPIASRRVCAQCGKRSTRICSKCDVGLHDYCFEDFHAKM